MHPRNEAQLNPIDQLVSQAKKFKSLHLEQPDRSKAKHIHGQVEKIIYDDLDNKPGSIRLTSEQLTKLIYCLGLSGASWPQFSVVFKSAISLSILQHYDDMNAADIATTFAALAQLGYRNNNTQLISCLLESLHQLFDQFNTTQSAKILRSFAMLNLKYFDIGILVPDLLLNIARQRDPQTLQLDCDTTSILKLKSFLSYYQHDFYQHQREDLKDTFQIITTCVDNRIHKLKPPTSSSWHKKIGKLIKTCTTSPFLNEYKMGGGFPDMYFPNEKKVIELYGPHHYEEDGTLTVTSQFRIHLMEKQVGEVKGVYIINYQDWAALQNNREAELAFVRDTLRRAGIPLNDALLRKNIIDALRAQEAKTITDHDDTSYKSTSNVKRKKNKKKLHIKQTVGFDASTLAAMQIDTPHKVSNKRSADEMKNTDSDITSDTNESKPKKEKRDNTAPIIILNKLSLFASPAHGEYKDGKMTNNPYQTTLDAGTNAAIEKFLNEVQTAQTNQTVNNKRSLNEVTATDSDIVSDTNAPKAKKEKRDDVPSISTSHTPFLFTSSNQSRSTSTRYNQWHPVEKKR